MDLNIQIETDALIKGSVVEQLVWGAEQCGIGQQEDLNWQKNKSERKKRRKIPLKLHQSKYTQFNMAEAMTVTELWDRAGQPDCTGTHGSKAIPRGPLRDCTQPAAHSPSLVQTSPGAFLLPQLVH